MVGVRLPEEMEKRLNELAERQHRSKSYYIKKALQELLDEEDDLLEAEAISQRLREKKEKTYTLEEVMVALKKKYE